MKINAKNLKWHCYDDQTHKILKFKKLKIQNFTIFQRIVNAFGPSSWMSKWNCWEIFKTIKNKIFETHKK